MDCQAGHDVQRAKFAVAEARALLFSSPEDRSLFAKLIASLDSLAQEYARDRQIPEALAAYEESVEVRRRVALMVPNDVELQCLLSFGLAHLADAQAEAGYKGKAEALNRERLTVLRSLRARFPQSLLVLQCLIPALQAIASLDVQSGNFQAARVAYQQALAIARECALRPEATDGDKARLIHVLIKTGETLENHQQLREARELYEDALAVVLVRVAENKESDLRSDIPYVALILARLCNRLGDYDYALRLCEKGIGTCQELLSVTPSWRAGQKQMAKLMIQSGQSLCGMRQGDLARSIYADALMLMRRFLADEPNEFALKEDLSCALEGLFDAMALDRMYVESARYCRECVAITRDLYGRAPLALSLMEIFSRRLFSLMFVEERAGRKEYAQAAAEERLALETRQATSEPSPPNMLRMAEALWFAARYRQDRQRQYSLRQVLSLLTSLKPSGLLTEKHKPWLDQLERAFPPPPLSPGSDAAAAPQVPWPNGYIQQELGLTRPLLWKSESLPGRNSAAAQVPLAAIS